jgi:non-specific serine/threonine protein kinase
MAVQFAAFAASFLSDRATATRLTADLVATAEAGEAPWCIAWSRWACALLELIHGDDLHTAMNWVQQALEMSWQMGDTWLPAWGLWLSACICARMGSADRSAFLFGGAQQRLRRTRVLVEGLLPWWQVQQQAQKLARTALGDEEFDAQQALGEAASYQDMMELALRPLPRPDTDAVEPEPPAPLGGLSRREQEVAGYVAQEWTNREIAEHLNISVRTVDVYVAALIRKLDARGRGGVAVKIAALREQS